MRIRLRVTVRVKFRIMIKVGIRVRGRQSAMSGSLPPKGRLYVSLIITHRYVTYTAALFRAMDFG